MSPMNPRLLRPRASGLTDPRTISGLELWLDFGDHSTLSGTNIPNNGADISEARDKSGKGWAAVQATGANQPTLVTNAINGRSVASFNGSSDRLTISSFTSLTALTAFAVIYRTWTTDKVGSYAMVASQNYNTTTGVALFVDPINNFQDWLAGDFLALGNGFNSGRAPRAAGPNATLTSNQPIVASTVLSSTEAGLWVNGTSVSSRVATTGTASGSGTFVVGGNAAFGDYWDGSIAELLIYTQSLTTSQRRSVQSWLGLRYNITVA